MKNKKILLTALSFAFVFMSTSADAALRSKSSASKFGVFIGAEEDYENIKYTHYIRSISNNEIAQKGEAANTTTSTDKATTPYLAFGARYYPIQYFGIGAKGWIGKNEFSNVSIFDAYWNGYSFGDYTIKANALTYGVEGQVYLDFLHFGTKIRNAIGLTFGAGYEMINYSDVTITTEFKTDNIYNSDTAPDYTDAGIVLDAALHYTIHDMLRFEVGYKLRQHNKTQELIVSNPSSWGNSTADRPRIYGFNIQDTIYAGISLQF